MALLLIEVTEDVEVRAVRAQDGHTHAVGERNSDRANVLALADERDILSKVNESVMHGGENVHHRSRRGSEISVRLFQEAETSQSYIREIYHALKEGLVNR